MVVTGLTAAVVSGKVGEHSVRFGRRRRLRDMAVTTLVGKIVNWWILRPEVPYHES